MIPELLNSYSLVLADVRASVGDLSDDQWTVQFSGVTNHPAWTIGHLIYSAQAIAGELGVSPWLPASWVELFRTGSSPKGTYSLYPSGSALVAALSDAEHRIRSVLSSAGSQQLGMRLPDERYTSLFPSVGHAVLHVLCGHTSYHLGQLAVWRAAAGLPRIHAQ